MQNFSLSFISRIVGIGALSMGLAAPVFAQGGIQSFKTMFENGCVAPKLAGKNANVAGLTRLSKKEERFWLSGKRGQVWVRDATAEVPSPRLLVLSKGEPSGCRVVARNVSEKQLRSYLEKWDRGSTAFIEDKSAHERGPETTTWLFTGKSGSGEELLVLAISVPFLKSATVTVARLEDL